eukprot:GHVU01010685.1.p1 GENE.GHVU01010685.1~~GHVU01010685.1.p1  ORF type:complete len:432 (-),score=47.28 GHVU01010685.1:2626-3921(-)
MALLPMLAIRQRSIFTPPIDQGEDIRIAPYTGTADELLDHLEARQREYEAREREKGEATKERKQTSHRGIVHLTGSFSSYFNRLEILGQGMEGVVRRYFLREDPIKKDKDEDGGCEATKETKTRSAFAVKETPLGRGMTPSNSTQAHFCNLKKMQQSSPSPGGSSPPKGSPDPDYEAPTRNEMRQETLARILDCCGEAGNVNVCKHYCFVETKGGYYAVMEDLYNPEAESETLSYQVIAQWAEDMKMHHQQLVKELFRQLMQGLDSIHRHDLIHRDIKLDNVIVTREVIERNSAGVATSWRNPVLKIIDLTACISKEDGIHVNEVVTPGYLAPELCVPEAGSFQSQFSDIYAAGVVLGEMSMGVSPVPQCPDDHTVHTELMQRPRDNGVINHVNIMLTTDKFSRPTAEEVLEGAWMTSTTVIPYVPPPQPQ